MEKTGSPQGAAADLVGRLLEMEAQVEAWERAATAEAEGEESPSQDPG